MSDVPIAWFTAEVAAENLITGASGTTASATLEHRSTHDVLSLTWLFAHPERLSADLSLTSVRRTGRYLQVERLWWIWCKTELSQAPATISREDLAFALGAWSRLTDTDAIRGANLYGLAAGSKPLRTRLIGLHRARQAVDAFCRRHA
ncbi:hypothetical protein [Actinoplanes sp. NPDC049265]|uniref:hypothetical protein n=1 Tax=Actinoplanes sp. NPDC049265 TaxID=3363902 RepID=UPI00372446C6